MIPRRLYAKRIIRNYRQPGDIPHDKVVMSNFRLSVKTRNLDRPWRSRLRSLQ